MQDNTNRKQAFLAQVKEILNANFSDINNYSVSDYTNMTFETIELQVNEKVKIEIKITETK